MRDLDLEDIEWALDVSLEDIENAEYGAHTMQLEIVEDRLSCMRSHLLFAKRIVEVMRDGHNGPVGPEAEEDGAGG